MPRAEHERVIWDEAGPTELVEPSTEQLEPLTHVAALDESDSVVALSRSMPGGQRVSCRIVGQRRHVALKLGPAVGETVQVLEGLKPGERVVTVGSFLLRAEAARVRSST